MSEASFAERSRADSLWLMSYPKSGNTWLRFIVFHLLQGRAPVHSRELDGRINAAHAVTDGEAMVIKKSHSRCGVLTPFLGDGSRIIYIYRHPLDVMQSALNYAALTGEITAGSKQERDGWVARYIENGGNPIWLDRPIGAGSWSVNVRSWLKPRSWPSLILSYEDSLADPHETVRRIAAFLNVALSAAALERCVAETSFKALKAFEQDEIDRAWQANGTTQGRFTVPERLNVSKAGVRFFNSGRAGAYRDVFSRDEIEGCWAKMAPTAERLGYTL